jgi:hypothetical protein
MRCLAQWHCPVLVGLGRMGVNGHNGVLICGVVVIDPQVAFAFHREAHARVLRERSIHLAEQRFITMLRRVKRAHERGRGSRCRWRRQ